MLIIIGFAKVSLAAGESKEVSFTLRRAQLSFAGLANPAAPIESAADGLTVEPGEFGVWAAPSAVARGAHATFVLLPPVA